MTLVAKRCSALVTIAHRSTGMPPSNRAAPGISGIGAFAAACTASTCLTSCSLSGGLNCGIMSRSASPGRMPCGIPFGKSSDMPTASAAACHDSLTTLRMSTSTPRPKIIAVVTKNLPPARQALSPRPSPELVAVRASRSSPERTPRTQARCPADGLGRSASLRRAEPRQPHPSSMRQRSSRLRSAVCAASSTQCTPQQVLHLIADPPTTARSPRTDGWGRDLSRRGCRVVKRVPSGRSRSELAAWIGPAARTAFMNPQVTDM
jgi:hypothetical protein